MIIHGLRIYPQSVEVVPGANAPLFVQGSVSETCSDFFYTFRPLAPAWRDHVFADTFCARFDAALEREDPRPGLREQFGPSLLEVDIPRQLIQLRGDDFATWGPRMHFCEGAFLPVFRERPSTALLQSLFWEPSFRLSAETWPGAMRSLLHLWDDIYWQLFTTDPADIEVLLQAHAGDPKLKLFHVDFDREYPDPSNQELTPAGIPHPR